MLKKTLISTLFFLLFGGLAQAGLTLEFYGVKAAKTGDDNEVTQPRTFNATVEVHNGRLLARLEKPVVLQSHSEPIIEKTVTTIELAQGPQGMYRDLFLIFNSLSADDLFLFPKERSSSKPALLTYANGNPQALTVTQSPAPAIELEFRRLTKVLIDVDSTELGHITDGVLVKPTARPFFQKVYDSNGAVNFFGIEQTSIHFTLEGLAAFFNDVQLMSLKDSRVRLFLETTHDIKLKHELQAQWGQLLREKIKEIHAGENLSTLPPRCSLLLK